ncbi:peptide-methionine (S)-S-oxide reductase [archaeon]|nr:MAG: peptide-methionine (S)-S-oxide reductase [archaeon]
MEKATFAAGCFWGVQAAFDEISGVVRTLAGYTGGMTTDPTYKDVCSGRTGHAEAVEATYDPSIVSYDELLDIFWRIHDPTTLNRQGPDVGSQYRSAIFYHNDTQRKKALDSKHALEKTGRYSKRVVTEIVAAGPFYPAEDYHQHYLRKRPGSCSY